MQEYLLMDQAPFFRIDLDGQKHAVDFPELHPVLRDVVYYFEVNLNESSNLLIVSDYSNREYWKYLSVSWTPPEFSESKRYAWLCERGCLALLNGLSVNFLYEQQYVGSEEWRQVKALASESLPYLKLFKPSDESLEKGRDFLLSAFTYIAEMSPEDLDDNGFTTFDVQEQGAWFTKNIVGDYFRSTAKLDFG